MLSQCKRMPSEQRESLTLDATERSFTCGHWIRLCVPQVDHPEWLSEAIHRTHKMGFWNLPNHPTIRIQNITFESPITITEATCFALWAMTLTYQYKYVFTILERIFVSISKILIPDTRHKGGRK